MGQVLPLGIPIFVFSIIYICTPAQAKGIGLGLSELGLLDTQPTFEPESETEKTFYVATFFKADWYTASKYCRHIGMLLASINSEKERHLFEETINRYGDLDLEYVWISGTNYNSTSNDYIWNNSKTTTPITYSKWHKGYPTSSGTDVYCILVQLKEGGYGWINYSCDSSKYYFVCEITDFNECTNFCLNKH